MNTQSEALRLAEWLQANYEADEIDQAADLLRKLFADKEKLERLLTTSANCERRLHALNAELLEALKNLYTVTYHLGACPGTVEEARDAIVKAEGEQA